ncbi:MAG: hypothetical protein ACI84K_001896 [Pseudohongiellaceae bacterium]|jgi:hypothetical protein
MFTVLSKVEMTDMVGLAVVLKDIDMSDIIFRLNENSGTFFRSGRFFKVDSKYFFSTREGAEIGPYNSVEEAAGGLCKYIDSIAKDGNTAHAKKYALSGNWAFTVYQ